MDRHTLEKRHTNVDGDQERCIRGESHSSNILAILKRKRMGFVAIIQSVINWRHSIHQGDLTWQDQTRSLCSQRDSGQSCHLEWRGGSPSCRQCHRDLRTINDQIFLSMLIHGLIVPCNSASSCQSLAGKKAKKKSRAKKRQRVFVF